MSLSETIGSVAASNPAVGVAVAQQSVGVALLAGLQSGNSDPGTALLGAIGSRAVEVSQLLSSLTPNLGRNINTSV